MVLTHPISQALAADVIAARKITLSTNSCFFWRARNNPAPPFRIHGRSWRPYQSWKVFEMGNPPKPNELKRAQGNPGKRPMKALATVTKIPQATAKAPEHLSPASQELWTRLRETAFWISNTDQSSLQLLCEKLDRRNELVAKLQSSDFVLFTDKGYAYANPLVGMLSTIETEITKLFSLLGLTSTDRSRLGVAEVRVRSKLEELAQARQNKG